MKRFKYDISYLVLKLLEGSKTNFFYSKTEALNLKPKIKEIGQQIDKKA